MGGKKGIFMPLIRCIDQNFGLFRRYNCEDDDCRFCEFEPDGVTNYVLEGERITKDDRICDCIIFLDINEITIFLVELKSSWPDIDYAKTQIENGAQIAVGYLGYCKINLDDCEFTPVVLHKSKDPSVAKRIRNTMVLINGKKEHLRFGEVGCRLSEISV